MCHKSIFLGLCSLIEKLLCTSVNNTTFINPGRPKMANATQESVAFKISIIMCEAYKRLLETDLLQAVIKVFHLDPCHAAGLYR